MRDVRFRAAGVKPHRFRHRLDIASRHGLPVTSPSQTFCHLARHLGLVDLVALGDRLARKNRCAPTDLLSYARGWQGQCRHEAVVAAGLVRDRVDSVPETALRLLMVLGGLPEPQVDIHVRDVDGHIIFRIDLGFEEARLAIEYDGRWHDDPEQHAYDVARRQHLAISEGWRFEVVTAADLYDEPALLLTRLASAMAECGIAVPALLADGWRRHFKVAAIAS